MIKYAAMKKFKLNNLLFKTFLVLVCLVLAILYNNLKGS